METTREFIVKVVRDTNKDTYRENFSEPLPAAKYLMSLLSDEERVEVFSNYCCYCGLNDPDCQYWNDE